LGKEQEVTVFVWFAPTARSKVPEDVTRFESDATPEEILERVSLGMQQGIQQMQHLAEALEVLHWTRPRQGQDIVISKDDQDLEDLHLFAVFLSCVAIEINHRLSRLYCYRT